MKIPLMAWIFTCGLCIGLHYSLADTAVINSELQNLLSENSSLVDTEINSESSNFSESTFHNTVHSSSLLDTHEECRTGNCEKTMSTSSASSSPSSKILWNLVSIPKSTTNYPSSVEISDAEEHSTSLRTNITAMDTHSPSDHSIMHNSSLHSSENELDSEIHSEDTDYVSHASEDAAEIMVAFSEDANSSFTASPMYMHMITEVLPVEENMTIYDSETKQDYSDDYIRYSNVSNSENFTEYTSMASTQNTAVSTDDELDFTTYFYNSSDLDSNELSAEEMMAHNENFTELSVNEPNITVSFDPKEYSMPVAISNISTEHKISMTEDDIVSNDENLETNANSENNGTEVPEEYNMSGHDYTVLSSPSSNNYKMLAASEITSISMADANDPEVSTFISVNTNPASNGEIIETEEIPNVFTTLLDLNITESAMINELDIYTESKINEAANSTEREFKMSENTHETPYEAMDMKTNEMASNGTISTDTQDDFVTSSQVTTYKTEIPTTMQNPLSSYKSEDFTEKVPNETNPVPYDDITSEISIQDMSSTTTDPNISVISEEEVISTTLTPYMDANINEVQFSSAPTTSTEYHGLNDMSNHLFSTQNNYDTVAENSKPGGSSTIFTSVSYSALNTSESNFEVINDTIYVTSEESLTVSSSTSDPFTSFSENGLHVPSDRVPLNYSTNKSAIYFPEVTHSSSQFSETHFQVTGVATESSVILPSESESENHLFVSENSDKHVVSSEATASVTERPRTEIPSSRSTTESSTDSMSLSIIPSTADIDGMKSSTDEYSHGVSFDITEEKYKSTDYSTQSETETASESRVVVDITTAKNLDIWHMSDAFVSDVTATTPTSVDSISLETAETHREGKHIPFSITPERSTPTLPLIFNVSGGTFTNQLETTVTERNFDYFIYDRIRTEDLTPNERANVINTFVKLLDKSYSNEKMNDTILKIHFWLLRAIADEYKNATLNASGANNAELDEVEFENLPQILYVQPTPEVISPNISLTFIVKNKWRNATFDVDIIITILKLHTEDLKRLVIEIEEIYFSHDISHDFQRHDDLYSLIVAKYGTIILPVCGVTVVMILFLICLVIYYRRKNRHSAHCLTDDKLHRNMQEAMGIDLNPAVIILQEEIREKAALNGNKISSLDDDEGWLAPIEDVPVAEDNSAPFVQDTKL